MILQTGQQITFQKGKAIGQLNLFSDYNIASKIFFFKNPAENEIGRLFAIFVFKKALYNIKASGQHLSFHMFW